jgi:glycosyltransferase involved in cell wall biosynthesis
MRLDVLVPTLNRARSLERTVRSLLRAEVPQELQVLVTVVDNCSTDDTRALVERFALESGGRVAYVSERRRGKSRALNAGIASTSGDLIGMIDDDEEVDRQWYRIVAQAFQDPSLDFIGGPYIPKWPRQPPDWLPRDYLAVIGDVDSGPEARDYGSNFNGILKGGNAVIRRRVLERAGPYAEWLGPSGNGRLLSCEDEEMYFRLLKTGARGRYLPSLVVYHHVFEERLNKAYYRRWCFWRGVSRGLMDRVHPLPVRYLAGVPRFLYGRAGRGTIALARRALRRQGASGSFSDELSLWDLAGYMYGRHVYRLALHLPYPSRRKQPPGPTSGVNP